MSEKVVVQELIFREDGTVCGLGNSHRVELADGEELVASGKYKFEGKSLGETPKTTKKKKGAEAVEDGRD